VGYPQSLPVTIWRHVTQNIIVGYDPDFYPFTCQSGDNCSGLLVDMTQCTLELSGLHSTFVPVALSSSLSALDRGEIDALCGVAVTPQRAPQYAFSSPLTTTGGAWFFRDGPDGGARSPQSPPRSVATPAAGPLAAIIETQFPGVEIVSTSTYGAAFAEVLNGTVEAAALNYHVGCLRLHRDYPGQFRLPETMFQSISLALAFRSHQPAPVIEKINAAIVQLQNSGELKAIEAQYVPRPEIR